MSNEQLTNSFPQPSNPPTLQSSTSPPLHPSNPPILPSSKSSIPSASLKTSLPAFQPSSLPAFQPGLLAALALYLCLALAYFFIVPIFEAPDEWTHTGHIKHIAEGQGLPVMLPGQGIWGGQQPPLYYALGALIVQPFSLDGFNRFLEDNRNPHASIGYALDPGNKNNYLHGPDESFPYRGLALTVHVLRLYSMGFGLLGLVFMYLTAYELMNGRVSSWASPGTEGPLTDHQARWFATVVALFVACQPMYAFITASVANEPANIAFCAGVVWLAQRYVRYGPSPGWGRAVALGGMLGLAALSKMTGLSVGLVAVLAFLIAALSTRKQPGAAWLLWRDGAIVALSCLLVAGWWYWRNYQLYGDFFQRGLYKLYFNQEPQPLTLSGFLYTLKTGEVSFWATFGWLNIVGPDWLYSFYRLIGRAGLVATAMGLTHLVLRPLLRPNNEQLTMNNEQLTTTSPQSPNPSTLQPSNPPPFNPSPSSPPILQPSNPPTLQPSNLQPFNPPTLHSSILPLFLHLLFPPTLAFSLARLVALEGGMQGRQILPALGSLVIVMVWGWWALSPPAFRWPILGAMITIMLGLAIWLPFGVVAREYIPAPTLTATDLPADLIALNWTYQDEMRLLGAHLGAEVVRPGERVPVTLYWQALKPMTTNYSVFVHLIGRDYESVGQFNTYPGLGLRPTTTLAPGQIVADTYPVQVNGGAEAPTRLLVNVGLFDFDTPGRPGLPAIDASGQEVPPTVAQLKLTPTAWPESPNTPPMATFGDTIWLAQVEFDGCTHRDQPCVAELTWLPQSRPPQNFTVFLQLWQAGQFVQSFDAQPLNGDYPTGLWDAGEVIVDPHPLDLSRLEPGVYQVEVGWYDLETLVRLPATQNGQRLPADAVEIGTLTLK